MPSYTEATAPGNSTGVTATVTPLADCTSLPGQPAPAVRPSTIAHVLVRGTSVSLDDETGKAFVTDCARNIEGLRSDWELKETWGLDEHGWAGLAENASLLDAIKIERERRIRSGEAAREAAQQHFAQAPSVLNEILHDQTVSPRHRIEAAKELRQVAGSGLGTSGDRGERFIISISLGEDHKLLKEFDALPRAPQDGEAQ
ncbi:hypothetical protein [Bradyrhizobium sp. Leo121]|uniref:hypothetical protein n=1 Tax=Bradyrhizobium sp. Leo121 TaxID=1571195 RepID=UPI00102A738C|nr:hypothetical protein [Bradyrhizobium sp. Leo121]RZN32305.1 hypothetical protein CWO90_13955 [Bradyrhizobium sp. Leo121]